MTIELSHFSTDFLQTLCLLHSYRFNALLNQELAQHPTIFSFMNRLKTNVYENGVTLVAQVNQGNAVKAKATLAAQRLSERAKTIEQNYTDDLITPEDVLKIAACHFDDDKLVDVLRNLVDKEDNEAARAELNSAPTPPAPTPAAQTSNSSSANEDERSQALLEDPDLTDMDSEDWPVSDWLQSDAEPQAANITPSHSTAQPLTGPRPDVQDLVKVICIVCNKDPDYQEVLVDCGHIFCRDCVRRPEFAICPLCNTPKGRTSTIHVSTIMFAWKADITRGFVNPNQRPLHQDHALDGRRPGDETHSQELIRLSEELARTLEQQDQYHHQRKSTFKSLTAFRRHRFH